MDTKDVDKSQQIAGGPIDFSVNGHEYKVYPAKLGELKEVSKLFSVILVHRIEGSEHESVLANFYEGSEDKAEALQSLLKMALRLPEDKLSEIDSMDIWPIINFYLFRKRPA